MREITTAGPGAAALQTTGEQAADLGRQPGTVADSRTADRGQPPAGEEDTIDTAPRGTAVSGLSAL